MQRRCGSEQLEHAPVIDINPRLDAQSKANLKLEAPPRRSIGQARPKAVALPQPFDVTEARQKP